MLEFIKLAKDNRVMLSIMQEGSCYSCMTRIPYAEISEWVDNQKTAICPYCGIDAVLPFGKMREDILQEIHNFAFNFGRSEK